MADGKARLTVGAPASVLPDVDPVADAIWADQHPSIGGVWFIDHLLGWFPRGVRSGVVSDPHAVMDPFSLIAAAAAATSDVTIGLAATDPVRRTPTALAQAALTAGWLGGRPIALGLGSGARHNLAPFGLAKSGQVAYMEEACKTFNALTDADDEDALGVAAHSRGRLYVAALGPRMMELVARYGDGWMPANLHPKPYAKRAAALRERVQELGREPDAVKPIVLLWAALAETREESMRLLREPVARAPVLYNSAGAFERFGVEYPIAGGHYMPNELEPVEAQAVIDSIPDEIASNTIVSGSIEDVRDLLDAYDAAGCEHVILYDVGRYVHPGGVERSRECLLAITEGRDRVPL